VDAVEPKFDIWRGFIIHLFSKFGFRV